MIEPRDVTAVLVTRGDQPQMMERIRESLIFEHVVVWDNSERYDVKTAGRYYAIREYRTNDVVYFQDDDVIVPEKTQRRLCEAYMPGVVIANYGHGEDDGGYGDLPLVGGGAILDADLPWKAAERYLEHYPLDEDFLHYADFAIGVLYEDFRHLYLPFEIELAVAQHPSRLCNQPWAAEMKERVTQHARAIRDGALVAA
jgi:hypothetical protein